MARIAAAPQRRSNLALWALVLMGVGLLSLLPITLLDSSSGGTSGSGIIASSGSRIAYFAFDRNADTLWLADPKAPSKRAKGLTIEHAPEYGIIPTLSPDGRSVAYLVLPPSTPAPGPDAPAELWVTSTTGATPRLVASGADLLVPAVWTADGQGLVFRRSDNATHLILAGPGGGETEVASSADALFPVGFAGVSLYYVELSERGSVLKSTQGATALLLSDGLTRDWALSPDGTRIAYLEMTLSGSQASSRAFLLDLARGTRTPVGNAGSNAFSPVWTAEGDLVIGQLDDGVPSGAAFVTQRGATSTFTSPERGFDVPLANDTQAGLAVMSFDAANINNPGRASLVVVGPDGIRREITSEEVTFLGWISP
ncbi:MAG: hypothetical protein AB7T32_09925 [Dehalococcoidia bacterium]